MERKKFLNLCSLSLFYMGISSFVKKDYFKKKESQKNDSKNDFFNYKLIPPLKKGDKIALVAPAYKSPKNFLPKLIKWAQIHDFFIVLDYLDLDKSQLFSATDQKRTQSFQAALDDEEIQAIWCVRGGYGCVRIIDQLDFSKFQKNPKWIIGYSDISVFHSHLWTNYKIPSIHGMMVKEFSYSSPDSLNSLKNALTGKNISYQISSNKDNKEGKTSGILVGGNLSVLYSLCGSNSSLNTSDKILFIEDVGEYLYHIDRMMINLNRNEFFSNLKGLIIGSMISLKDTPEPFGKSANQIILEVVSQYNFPVVFNFPAGHLKNNLALIFGKKISLVVDKKEVKLQYI